MKWRRACLDDLGSPQIEERFLASLGMTAVEVIGMVVDERWNGEQEANEEQDGLGIRNKKQSRMGGANSCLYRPLSYDRNLDCYTKARVMFVWI
jgi:hypothetical protein